MLVNSSWWKAEPAAHKSGFQEALETFPLVSPRSTNGDEFAVHMNLNEVSWIKIALSLLCR